MKGSVVGLIPVKGSSDRVKQKNLRDFAGSSLLEVKLNQLKDTKGFEDLIVSSEDDEVLQIAKKHGFSIHTRDPKYSTSDVPMSDVYSHIASEVKGDNIAWINVTNPLAESIIYTEAVELYNSIELFFNSVFKPHFLAKSIVNSRYPLLTPLPNSFTHILSLKSDEDSIRAVIG